MIRTGLRVFGTDFFATSNFQKKEKKRCAVPESVLAMNDFERNVLVKIFASPAVEKKTKQRFQNPHQPAK